MSLDGIDEKLDLVLEREIDVPVELVWRAWTEPAHLEKWFTPKPWTTSDCVIELRPGGEFTCTMNGPNGERMREPGCFLEVVPRERLVFTDALLPGFRPAGKGFMTAIVTMEPTASGTRYRAVAKHKDESDRTQHEDMGFYDGWGTALDQLVAHAKTM